MAIEHHDGLEALRRLIDASGVEGNWSEDGTGKHTFKSQRKGVLNYWPRTGTVQCQGKTEPQAELEAIFAPEGAESKSATAALQKEERTRIFVVHGHDTRSLEQLELVLRRLGLDPYILDTQRTRRTRIGSRVRVKTSSLS